MLLEIPLKKFHCIKKFLNIIQDEQKKGDTMKESYIFMEYSIGYLKFILKYIFRRCFFCKFDHYQEVLNCWGRHVTWAGYSSERRARLFLFNDLSK